MKPPLTKRGRSRLENELATLNIRIRQLKHSLSVLEKQRDAVKQRLKDDPSTEKEVG